MINFKDNNILNIKENTYIKPSKIHGLGLFAKIDIKKGRIIKQGFADFSFQDEWIIYVKKWKIKSFAFNNGYCMINHSENPNVKRGKKMIIIALRDIKAHEEITENYHTLPDEENPFKVINLEEMVWRTKRYKK